MNIAFPKLREIFGATEEKTKDVLQVVIADMHSGSNYALFVDRVWQGLKGATHVPNSKQIKIRYQWDRFAEEILAARQGKRIRLIHNGDAIDGDHHHSGDVCSLNEKEHADIHIELINELQKRIDWQAGDELYYTKGTQTHVHDQENYIGEQLNAVPDGDYYCWDFLPLETNGVLSWFAHHGSEAGRGANEGNGLRNWLKDIYFDCKSDGVRPPDIVYSGHVHRPAWQPYGYRTDGFVYKEMHGIILPSWQMKTTYGYQKAAFQRNKIGGVFQEIKADGTICIPVFCVMDGE